MCTGKIRSFISVINGITLRNAKDKAMYSAYAVLKAISVCSLLAQYMMTSLVLDLKLSASSVD